MTEPKRKSTSSNPKAVNVRDTIEDVMLSFQAVMEKRAGLNGKERYGTAGLIDETNKKALDAFKAAVEGAIEIGIRTKWGGEKPRNIKLPLKKGEDSRPNDPNYQGKYVFNCYSDRAPIVVDKNMKKIIDPTQMYSGCRVNLGLTFYPFDVSGSKGIAVGLEACQKIADGDPLAGSASAETYFTSVAANDDEFDESLN